MALRVKAAISVWPSTRILWVTEVRKEFRIIAGVRASRTLARPYSRPTSTIWRWVILDSAVRRQVILESSLAMNSQVRSTISSEEFKPALKSPVLDATNWGSFYGLHQSYQVPYSKSRVGESRLSCSGKWTTKILSPLIWLIVIYSTFHFLYSTAKYVS